MKITTTPHYHCRTIKILFFLILSIASTLALIGAFKYDHCMMFVLFLPSREEEDSLNFCASCRRETSYIDTGLFLDNKNDNRDDFSLNGDSLSNNKNTEEELTFVPGEEWAGSISATHAPEQSSPVVEEQQTQVTPEHKETQKDDKTPDIGIEDQNEDDDDEYVRDGKSSPGEMDDDYTYNPSGSDEDEEYSYDPEDVNPIPENKSDVIDGTKDEELSESLDYLKSCTTLECIKKAHNKLQGKTKFNAPHFFLIGFQKCATTSVNHYLRGHPEYLPSVLKEAHYFTACRKSWNDTNCKAKSTKDYIDNYLRIKDVAENGLLTATVDASVDYAWKGEELAQDIHKMFPWLKIVVMLREPISRVISYTRMWTQKGVRTSTHKENRIACDSGEELFDCLYPHLTPTAYTGHYAVPLEGWLKVWPADQIHVIQFEEFVSNTDAVMRRLKKFLGMDPTLPEDVQLYNVNTRKDSGDSPMKRRQYRTLVEMARPDSEKVANLLHKYGLANRKEWMGRWQSVWDGVLNSCNASRICMVNSN